MKSFFSSLKYDFDKVYKLWCRFLSYKNHLCRFLPTYAVSIDGYVQKCYTKCKKSNGGETWVISNMASCIVDALIRNKVIDIQSTSVYQYGRVDIRLSHTALREMAHCTKAPVSIQEYYGPIQRHTKQLSKAIRESQNKLWWAPLNTPNPSDVVQICDRFTCGKMQEYLVYFKFLRKWRWHKDALQMAGERVFRGDLIFLIISFC